MERLYILSRCSKEPHYAIHGTDIASQKDREPLHNALAEHDDSVRQPHQMMVGRTGSKRNIDINKLWMAINWNTCDKVTKRDTFKKA